MSEFRWAQNRPASCADAERAEWAVDLRTLEGDFRGRAVRGRKGERFVYLPREDDVSVDVDLTDEHGMPRCARLRPPALQVRHPTS